MLQYCSSHIGNHKVGPYRRRRWFDFKTKSILFVHIYHLIYTYSWHQNVWTQVICPASGQEAMYMQVLCLGDFAIMWETRDTICQILLPSGFLLCWWPSASFRYTFLYLLWAVSFFIPFSTSMRICSLPFVSWSWWEAAGRCVLGSCRPSTHTILTALLLTCPHCFHTQIFPGLTFLSV